MSVHIGILQTDSVLPQFRQDHGDYPEMFQRLFLSLPGRVDAELKFTNYDAQRALPADTSCDAYLITGSKCSVYDDQTWINALVSYLQAVLAARKKVIGVCFGHQLLAHYFGGRVTAAQAGWAVGVHSSRIVREQPWMGGDHAEMALLSSHQDQVVELPEAAEVYMSNDFCPVAGFTIGAQVITVQGHPEFAKEYAGELMHMRREVLGEATYQQGIASLSEATGEKVMARWLLEFLVR